MKSIANTEFRFKLSAPIEYSQNGQIEESHELVFVAPSMSARNLAAKLKQLVARAQTGFIGKISAEQLEKLKSAKDDDKSEENEEEGNNGDSIKAIMLGSDIDLEEFYKAFDSIAVKVGTVADGVLLKQAHIQKLSLKDYEDICFGYTANFIE